MIFNFLSRIEIMARFPSAFFETKYFVGGNNSLYDCFVREIELNQQHNEINQQQQENLITRCIPHECLLRKLMDD